MRGTIKFFNLNRGFGFITLSDGVDVYFSKTSLRRDREFDPVEGDPVECEVRDGRQGRIACHIEQISA